MIGPAMGPMNVALAKTQIATPLSTGPKKSASVPPTIPRGADAKQPPKKRHIMIVYRFWETAMGIWKIAKHKYPKNNGIFRPSISEAGPHI